MFATLAIELSVLLLDHDQSPDLVEQKFLQSLSDLDWISCMLPKMGMMKEFISSWADISDYLLGVVQDEKYESGLWSVKEKLIEMTGKALEAIGYGNVVLPAANRVQFLRTWLPYMRKMKMKDKLDSKAVDDEGFPYKPDSDLCPNIERAIVSLVLALPSNDQAEILGEWMKGTEQLKFPDLSEVFEVWCYRTKTAKRRLSVGYNGMAIPDELPACNSYDLNIVTHETSIPHSTCPKHECHQILCDHMDELSNAVKCEFDDRTTADVTVSLISRDGGQEQFRCHSSVLIEKSKFFADELSCNQPSKPKYIAVTCSGSDFDHHARLLKLLYLSEELVLDSFDSVKAALGVLRASVSLQCEMLTKSCMHYLEAVPWEEKEEEEILKIIPNLGPSAMPVLARIQPVDLTGTKNVFISAIRFATTIDRSFPPFGDDLRTSAQEQVEYMLLEDEETPLMAVDEDVRSELKAGLAKMFATLAIELSVLPLDHDQSPDLAEQKFLQSLSDLDWISCMLPKMGMMKEFISSWADISDRLLAIVQDEKYESGLWAVKAKLIEMTGKALEAIGYGNVVLPAVNRVQFLRTWLPYMRKMKDKLDSKAVDDEGFPYKPDNDLCQNIEGAIVSLVLALPSNDQAEILGDWMKGTEQLKFPDLSEAFEVWCYRTKTAKRRLSVGYNDMAIPDELPTCNSYDLNRVT